MKSLKEVMLAMVVVYMICQSAESGRITSRKLKRDVQSSDEAAEESSNRIDGGLKVELRLRPADRVTITEGDDLQLECTIRNKPAAGQVQWYYIVRASDGSTFDNFTIIANEVATIDATKYQVWTSPRDIYSLRVRQLRTADAGEYCCFLFVSYTETYRQLTAVRVSPKTLISRRTSKDKTKDRSKLDAIIEEAVEHDIEEQLGKRLNISMIKNNEQARTMIQNATEEIKNLLDIDVSNDLEFQNGSTKWMVTNRMKGMSSQVKTVVTSLLSKMSTVDSTLAKVLPLNNLPAAGSTTVPDWKSLYNEYRRQRGKQADTTTKSANIGQTMSNNLQSSYEKVDDSEQQEIEEQHNTIEIPPKTPTSNDKDKNQKKCEYQIIINEFDPQQCPSISNGRYPAAAAMYYEAVNHPQPPAAQAMGQQSGLSNEQLTRIENRLMDEMVNTKLVNQTVKEHESMLQKTEKVLEEQTDNLTKLQSTIKDMSTTIKGLKEEKEDIEQKLTEVMINILEVNKRLDIALKRGSSLANQKTVGVQSAAETIQCDKHPNVTHYKDCSEAAADNNRDSGIYYIRPLYSACPIPVWCDMDTYPGGWTLIQRRENGKVSFNRDWNSYRRGFGEVTGEHWLGNDNIFLLSNQAEYVIRVDLWDFFSSRVYAEYRTFKVEGERDGYRLFIGNYSGTAGDGLKSHNKQKFSARDRDQDMWEDYHCAYEWEGGWWFTNCWSSYLNGAYYNTSNPPYNGISWREWKEEQLFKSEMKIRQVSQYQKDEKPTKVEKELEANRNSQSSSQNERTQKDTQKDQPRQNIRHATERKLNREINEKI